MFIHFPLQIQPLGMDGASVMQGEQNEVAGLVKRENPFCLALHCICHRLHLAVSKAAGSVKSVKALETILATVYQHVNNSPNRLHRFQAISAVLALADDGNGNVGNADGDSPAYEYLKFKKVSYDDRTDHNSGFLHSRQLPH